MKYVTLAALAAALGAGACSHGSSRHFAMSAGAPAPTSQTAPTTASNPSSSNPSSDGIEAAPTPQSAPTPTATPTNTNTSGALTRTTETSTGVVGRALYAGGNVVLGVGDHTTGLLPHVGSHIRELGKDLKDDGVGGLPLVGGVAQHTVTGLDRQLNGVAAVRVVNLPVLGSSNPASHQAIGVAALSGQNATGSLASANLLNAGAQQPAAINVAGVQVLGQPGAPAAVGVSALPQVPAIPDIASVNVGLQQGSQLANVSVAGTQLLGQPSTPALVQAGVINNTPVTPVVQGAVGAVGGVVGGVTQTTGGLVGGLLGH